MQEAVEGISCQGCRRSLSGRMKFAMKAPSGMNLKCSRCALGHLPMLQRSMMTSAVVGTVLTLLNQGDLLFAGRWPSAFYWKVPLTYAAPFLVASWGALSNARR